MTASEDIFLGVAAPLAPAQPTATGWSFTFAECAPEPSCPPQPVRHRAGYAPFADFVTAEGTDPRALAADPLSLLRFLRDHISIIANDSALEKAVTVFFGNTLAGLRADAAWVAVGDGPDEVGAGRRSYVVGGIVERLAQPLTGGPEVGEAVTSDDEWLRGYAASLDEWAEEQAEDALPALPLPVPVEPAARKYRRPPLPEMAFFDASGQPIPYGRRWGIEGPAEDSYSVTSNLERFAPVHAVARALVEFLAQVYDVDVLRIDPADAELLQPHDDVREIVRVSPRNRVGAPLTLVLTGFPGVMVEAGVLHSAPFPACGCDACDDDVSTLIGELEDLVLAVARGGFAEHYPMGNRMEADFAQVSTDDEGRVSGSRSGRGEPPQLSPERLTAAAARLAALPHGWQPWSLRPDGAGASR